MLSNFELYNGPLIELDSSKKLINTLNAHSYNTLKKDVFFREAIYASDMLLPDGISVVLAMRILKGEKLKKIAGADLFHYERSEEHTSELQSRPHLVCRLLLEKKNKKNI